MLARFLRVLPGGSVAWQSAGFAYALAIRILPRRYRFRAAVVSARALQPLVRRSTAWRIRREQKIDGLRETSLDLVLMMLTRYGTTFDPLVTIDGAETLPEMNVPVLLAGPHAMLSALLFRLLADAGRPLALIAADPEMKWSGTRTPASLLLPKTTLLLAARNALKRGTTIGVFIDRDRPERRSRSISTSAGEIEVTTAILELALRQSVPIVFMATTIDARWHLTTTLRIAPHGAGATLDDVLAAFATFLDTHVHARRHELPFPR